MAKSIGPYELLDRISSGGMGEIYLATLTREGGFRKVVAVKRILPHLAREANFIKMFEAEARLSAQMNHANVVHVYDFGRDDEGAWIAMEYVDGYDMRAVLDKAGAPESGLPPDLALHILEQCAVALDYAYRRVGPTGEILQIIHRDVSPQNILVSMEGEVKLTDFGLAKACSLDTWSMSGMLKGKLAYMAPEQARGDKVDTRADIFALGVVLYEMLSGRRVYPSDSAIARLMDKVRNAEFESISTVAPELPPALISLVECSLSNNPDDRFSSAAEVAQCAREVAIELRYNASSQALARYLSELDPARVSPLSKVDSGTEISEKPIAVNGTQVAKSKRDEFTGIDDTQLAEPENTMGLSSSDIEYIEGRPQPHPWLVWAIAIATLACLSVGAWVWSRQPASDFVVAELPRTERPSSKQIAEPVTPPPPKERPPVPMSQLTVKVKPPQARCHVMSPLTKKTQFFDCAKSIALVPGPYRLVVSAEGFENSEAVDLDLAAEKALSVDLSLKPLAAKPCPLTVTSEPPGALVWLDGQNAKVKTPHSFPEVAPGKHSIRLTRSGFSDAVLVFECNRSFGGALSSQLQESFFNVQVGAKKLRVRAGSARSVSLKVGDTTVTVRVVANPKRSSITINARPYASVSLNGVTQGDTPQKMSVRNGKIHRIGLKRDAGSIGTLRLKIAPGTRANQQVPPPGTPNGG